VEHAINPALDRILPGSIPTIGHVKRRRESADDRHWRVANAAYYLAEKRGFAPGQELQDWFTAERLIPTSPAGK
jgi:hypothetical protein